MNSCVVLQGPLYDHCIDNLCQIIRTVPNCIVSTWNNENSKHIEQLRSAGPLEVILNTKPTHSGAQNLNYMTHSTSIGIDKAEELGFTHILRFRTDYATSEFGKFLRVCESMDPEKLVFMCWFNDHAYIIDYFTFGPVELMRKYYSAKRESSDNSFTHNTCNERFLQESFLNSRPVLFKDTLSKCQYCIKRAVDEGIELYVIKDQLNTTDLFRHFLQRSSYSVQ